MSKEKSKVRATLVYEDVTARYLEMQKQEEKTNERKLGFVLENNRDLYLYSAEGKRLWTEKGEGWHLNDRTAADEYAYCLLLNSNSRSYKVQGVDAKGRLFCEKELTGDACLFTLGGYVFLLYHSGMLVKCDLHLKELASLDLAPYTSNTVQHGKEIVPNVSFCLKNNDDVSLTIVNYAEMQFKVIPSPKDFRLRGADPFGYLYGTMRMNFKTVTVLDQIGEMVVQLRLKGNLVYQPFSLRNGYAHIETCNIGIHEFVGSRPDKTITRIYRMEPV